MRIKETFTDKQVVRLLSKLALTIIFLQTTGGSAQSTWQEQVTGLEETRYLTKVAFGAGKFVGVGGVTNGIALISTNGHFWTPVSISNTNLLIGVAFVGGMFVAVGEGGTLLTSADGLSWTNRNSGVSERLNAAGYGSGTFIVVGNNGAVIRSSDGISWTAGDSLTNSYEGIAFGNGVFVAVGSVVGSTNNCGEGTLISSNDGVSWTNHMIPLGALPLEVAFGDGLFVATGTDFQGSVYVPGVGYICIGGFRTALRSTNGVDWLTVTNGPNWQRSVCYGNGTFTSVGDFDIVTSQDGLNWNQKYSANGLYLSGVAFGNNKFVAVGGGKVMVSAVDGFVSDAAVPVSFSLQSFGFSQGGAFFGRDKTTFGGGGGGAGGGRGFNVAIANLTNLTVEETRNFDTWADRSSGGAHGDFVAYLDSIAVGKLVLVAVGDEAGLTQWGDFRCTKLPYAWVDEVIAKLQSCGSTNIGNYCYNDSWGMIFIKGQSPPLAEGLGSGLTFPSSPVRLYTTFPRTVPRPVMSISTQIGGGGFVTYTLTVTNVVPSRDIEIQYTDGLAESWQHLRTLDNPPTNVVQTSDFIMFSPARFFKAIMDGSVQLPPGF